MTMGVCMKHSTFSIKAGNFKAQCLQLMDEVNEKHISITITKHGKPVARLIPIEDTAVNFFGCLKNSVSIQKGILEPIDVKWEENE
jgi:prevent-host-death family protein